MPSKLVNEIIEFCNDNSIEIVSYGLAPNPNGFCYELYGDACSDEAHCLDEMLDKLTAKQERELKTYLFGSN